MSGFADGWSHGRPETDCGNGSLLKNTVAIREVLPKWVAKYGIKSLADAGAGDLNWMSKLNLCCEYRPYDIEPRLAEVIRWDIREHPLPMVDAILCRHVLNHFDEGNALAAVQLMRQSAKYLIANTGTGKRNIVGSHGHFKDYDLSIEPFYLGAPLESVADCRGQLALWDVWH